MISVLPRGSRFDPLDVADRELAASFDALVQQMFAIGELHAAAALINGNDRAAARIQDAVRGLDHMINDTRRTAQRTAPWRMVVPNVTDPNPGLRSLRGGRPGRRGRRRWPPLATGRPR